MEIIILFHKCLQILYKYLPMKYKIMKYRNQRKEENLRLLNKKWKLKNLFQKKHLIVSNYKMKQLKI